LIPESVRKTFEDVQRDGDRLVDIERSVLETMRERLSLEQLHDDVDVVVGFTDVVNLANAGVADARGCSRFAPDASPRVGPARAQRFHRHLSTQPRIAGAIDVAHPARSDERDHLIVTEPFASGERHTPTC
jgi:hypothetical protein